MGPFFCDGTAAALETGTGRKCTLRSTETHKRPPAGGERVGAARLLPVHRLRVPELRPLPAAPPNGLGSRFRSTKVVHGWNQIENGGKAFTSPAPNDAETQPHHEAVKCPRDYTFLV